VWVLSVSTLLLSVNVLIRCTHEFFTTFECGCSEGDNCKVLLARTQKLQRTYHELWITPLFTFDGSIEWLNNMMDKIVHGGEQDVATLWDFFFSCGIWVSFHHGFQGQKPKLMSSSFQIPSLSLLKGTW
jgi:hypothetical protein